MLHTHTHTQANINIDVDIENGNVETVNDRSRFITIMLLVLPKITYK